VVVDEIASDGRMAPWRDAALARGYRAVASFPLVVDDRCVAVLTAYSGEPGFFDEQEVELLERITTDLSFALEAMQREERRRAAERGCGSARSSFVSRPREAMLDSVNVISPVRGSGGEIVDFRYEYVNDADCALVGMQREQLLGRLLGERFLHFPGSERLRPAVRSAPRASHADRRISPTRKRG